MVKNELRIKKPKNLENMTKKPRIAKIDFRLIAHI